MPDFEIPVAHTVTVTVSAPTRQAAEAQALAVLPVCRADAEPRILTIVRLESEQRSWA
jgi:hypothetical protein